MHLHTQENRFHADYLGLYYFVQMLYHTLSRPNELRNLKISSITETHIFITPQTAKDGTVRAIPINQHLEKVLVEMDLRASTPEQKKELLNRQNDYVFGGKQKVGINRYSDTHRKILELLGLNGLGYDLYSYKYSAANDLITAGVPKEEISELMGHESTKVTDGYISARKIGAKPKFMTLAPDF